MIEGLSPIAGASLTRTDGAAPGRQTSGIGEIGFGDVLLEHMAATANAVRTAEQVSAAGIRGETDVRAVTDAVMSAERQLQAAIAIRDKITTAYLDMTRMQI